MEYGEYIDENPALNSIRYLVMKIVRLVGTMACEVVLLPLLVLTVLACFLSVTIPYCIWEVGSLAKFQANCAANSSLLVSYTMYMPLVFALGVFMLPVVYGLMLALGLPYRWKWQVPGLTLVRCPRCHAGIPDEFLCEKCSYFRLERLVTFALHVPNVLLTAIWAVHDVTMFVLVLA